ncbi:MAG: cupin domain-containing protein [Rhodanobacteraceae bacterium]
MRSKALNFEQGFRVGPGTLRGQVAEMTLRKGESTGGPGNAHDDSDQWLYVIAGRGEAIVNGRQRVLESGTVLLIEKGEAHEIRNTGTTNLRTLNFYSPPAY